MTTETQPEPVEGILVEATNQALAVLDPYEGELTELEERVGTIVYDLDSEAQRGQARSDRHQLGKVISRLDKAHAAVKAPLLDATRRLDGRRKDIKDRLLVVQGNPKGQLEAFEAKEKARIDGHFERIQELRDSGTFAPDFTPTASQVELVLDGIRKTVKIDDSWEEFKADAALAKTETIERLEKLLAERQQYEAEQAELARLREEKEARERADREARIAVEAGEKERLKAEEAASMERARVNRERQQALERAEKAQLEAEQKEEARAKEAAREIEAANLRAKRAVAEERERAEREQEEQQRQLAANVAAEEKRKEKQKHRDKIHADAVSSLVGHEVFGVDREAVESIVALIAERLVKNIEIVY